MREDSARTDRSLADALVLSGRHAEAIPIYRRLAETFPEEESHLHALAWALHDSGRLEEATACFETLFGRELARKVFTGFAYDELVRIYRAGQDWDALIILCERAAAAQPGDAGLKRTLGEAYLAAGKADGALRLCEDLVRLESDAPENWCALGNARLAASDPDGAEEAYFRAGKIEPADAATFWSRLADGFIRFGHPERAKAALERSLVLNPDDPHHWMDLAEVSICLGQPGAASAACDRAASLISSAAGGCWHRLGNLLMKKGLHPQATEAFARAVLAEPDNPRYLLRLAASYAARGLDPSAAETLRRAEALIGGEGKPSAP